MDNLILLVDDEDEFGEVLKAYLEDNGLSVVWAKDGGTAIRLFKENPPHLILLDVALPDKDGFEVAAEIRKSNAVVPIIFMTGTALDVENYNRAYEQLRVTNYMEKPVIPRGVLAQIRSLLRSDGLKKFTIGDFHITINGQQVVINHKGFQLREKEAQVFSLLLEKANMPVAREDIFCTIWKHDSFRLNNALDTAISRIKKVLIHFPGMEIRTIHATGYILRITV